MDQFYISIYESVIYKWVVLNANFYKEKGISFCIDSSDSKRLVFHCGELVGEIYFWSMHNIIEETIVDKDNKIIFYLHFRIVNMANTKRFIIDFLNQLVYSQQPKRIGMSCSCGITSSLFVEKIQKLSQMMNLPYHFEVVPINQITDIYEDFDMIILAPQTSYLEPSIKSKCKDGCYIMSIDASIFATSNYQQALLLIQDILR
ncbi:MAG: hypothetical protein RR512_04305 [Coprobacillus sp.]